MADNMKNHKCTMALGATVGSNVAPEFLFEFLSLCLRLLIE